MLQQTTVTAVISYYAIHRVIAAGHADVPLNQSAVALLKLQLGRA
jgi:hypothetical protein